MSIQTFGVATALDPPVTIGGASYSFAVEFNRHPTNRATAAESFVVSGVVESQTSISGNRKRLVMRRAPQTSTYTQLNGPGDSVEVAYQSEMGGNIAATHEAQRIYSHTNDRAFRGTDARDRVLPGDVCIVTVAGVTKAFLVTEATAFGQAPGVVNWAGSDPLPTPGSILHAPNAVVLSALSGCTVVFSPASGDLYDDCAVAWRNTTAATTGSVTRSIFDNPDGDPEPDLYPDDATFFTTAAEYWFDSRGNSFRFGSVGLGLVAADAIDVTCYQETATIGTELTPATTARSLVLLATGSPAGYGGTDDALAFAAVTTIDDFAVVLDVLDAETPGACSLEFRETSDADSRVAVMTWGATGTVDGLKQRTSAGGSLGSLTLVGASYTFPFQVRAVLSGTTLTFSHRQNSGASWTSEAPITVAHTGGRLSVGTTSGVRFSGIVAAVRLAPIEAAAALAVQQVQSFTGQAWSQAYTLPASTAFNFIRNGSTGEAMIEATTATARNVYVRSGTTLTLFSESSGDRIDFEQAASGSAPTPPGTAPRAGGTVNFADGGTATGDNVGNWHDVVILHDLLGEFLAGSGAQVSFARAPVFDSQNLPTLEYDVKGRALSDWTSLSPSDYTALWAEGVVYLKASFITGLSLVPGESLCIRAVGYKYSQRGGIAAPVINDAANVLEALDELWVDAGVGFTVGSAVGGIVAAGTAAYAPYPTAWTCNGGFWEPDAVAYGTKKSAMHGLSDALDAAGMPFGSFFFEEAFPPPLKIKDTAARVLYRSADDSTLPTCGSQPPKQAHDVAASGDFLFEIHPEGILGPSYAPLGMIAPGTLEPDAQYFGGHVLPSGRRYGYDAGVAADFGFTGVAFVPAGWFARLPDGAEIVEAYALVRANGLRICSWSQVFELQPDGTLHLEYERDDAFITYDGPVTGIGGSLSISTGTPAGSSGAISLALIGRRKNSQQVQLVGGGTHARNSNDWTHLGSGLAISTAESGKYKKVSVKEMLQKLIVNRNAVFADYELWPTIAAVAPSDSAGALASYLKGLMPAASATLIAGSGGTWGYESEQSGSYAVMSTALSISAIKCRFRLPSGLLVDEVIATPQSAMIAGWS